jgi:hypothetical protein
MAWDKTKMSKVDIRLFYAVSQSAASPDDSTRNADAWTSCRW